MGRHAIPVIFIVEAPTRLAATQIVEHELDQEVSIPTTMPNEDEKSEYHLRWHPGPAPDSAEYDDHLITMEGVTTEQEPDSH